MKKITFILSLLLIGFWSVEAQVNVKADKIEESQVPQAVKEAYNNAYGFPVKSWEKHESSIKNKSGVKYVASFESLDPSSGKMLTTRARYKEDGTFISYTTYFKAEDLPANIVEAAQKAYTGMQVKRGDKTGKGTETFFRVILRKGEAQKAVFICDLEGNPIQKGKVPTDINELEGE
jgi:hypothetical protein